MTRARLLHAFRGQRRSRPAKDLVRTTHDLLRQRWQRRLDAGEEVFCWRCRLEGETTRIDPRFWNLGRDRFDVHWFRGPECLNCATVADLDDVG